MLYSITNDQNFIEATDYFRYVDVVEKLSKKAFAYKKVQIINGERPDTLSYRLYGTPDYYWTFFITNDHLKEGLSQWPKSSDELSRHLTNQYKDLSAFRFPYMTLNESQYTALGLPINNEDYLPYLYLTYFIRNHTFAGEAVYATAKIRKLDSNLSLIWVDDSSFTWYAPTDEALNDMVGDGGVSDKYYQPLAEKIMYHSNTQQTGDSNFSVQFISDGTTKANILRTAWIKDIKSLYETLRPNINIIGTVDDTDLDRLYNLRCTQYWKDGSLAPSYYYDPTNIDTTISEYTAGARSTSYTSNVDVANEKNAELETITYVSPEYIRDFANEYRRLLNE